MVTTCQPANNGSGVTDLGGGGGTITKVGLRLQADSPYIGASPTSISFKLKKDGSPTGNGSMTIRDSDGTLLSTSTNTLDWSTLTTSYESYAFSFTGVAALELEDVVVVEGGSTSDANKVRVNISENDPREYSNQIATKYESGSWSVMSLRNVDVCMTYAVTGTGTRLPPPPLIARF